MVDWFFLLVVLAFIAGLSVGHVMTNWAWEINWRTPARIRFAGSFYKVVRLDRWRESMKNLEAYRDD